MNVLLFIAMFAALLAVALGVFSMVHGGSFNNRYGNKLMRYRLYFQAFAVLLFTLILLTR